MTSVMELQVHYSTHKLYDVTFYGDIINTILTCNPTMVDSWINETVARHAYPIVGLDIEWRPNTEPDMNNPVATLQLCVGTSCLVFQMLFSPFVPQSLISFLRDPNRTFLGVGIEADVRKLQERRPLVVTNYVDLRYMAADRLQDRELCVAGLKTLCLRVLGKEIEKPQHITTSMWDNYTLTAEQVQYATLDAFISFEIGRRLYSF